MGRARNPNRQKPLSLVYGDTETDFPPLPKRTKCTNESLAGKSYATAATANMTNDSTIAAATASTVTNPTSTPLSFADFEVRLKAQIEAETQDFMAKSIASGLAPVNTNVASLQTKMEQMEQKMEQLDKKLEDTSARLMTQVTLCLEQFVTQLASQLNIQLTSQAPLQPQAMVEQQQQAFAEIEHEQQEQARKAARDQPWLDVPSKRKTAPSTADTMMDTGTPPRTFTQTARARDNKASTAGNSGTQT